MGNTHRRLGDILVQRGSIDTTELAAALAEQAGAEFVDPRAVRLSDAALALTTPERAVALQFLPVALEGDDVVVVVSDPHRPDLDAISEALGKPVTVLVGAAEALAEAIEAAYEVPLPGRPSTALETEAPDAPSEAEGDGAEDSPSGPIESEATVQDKPRPPAATIDESGPDLRAPPLIDLSDANGTSLPELAQGLDADADPEAVRPLLKALLSGALAWGAAAIRFHCAPQGLVVQYATDGAWRIVLRLPDWAGRPVMQGLRQLLDADPEALLGTLDGLRPQVTLADGATVGLAVATVDGGRIERVTLGVRDPRRLLSLDAMGLSSDMARRLRMWTAARQGLILLAGPHDSGRTVLLRAIAESMSGSRATQIVLRDPIAPTGAWVERGDSDADGAAAVAEAIASDPDVLLIDDCDGPQTASAAFSAALRGRLVIAVLRGPDAAEALQRMRDQGTSDLLLGEQLLGVVETRLVRLLCSNCWVRGPLDRPLARGLNLVVDSIPGEVPTSGPGCMQCHHSGYRGRRGIVSRVELDGGVKDGASAEELRQAVTMHRPRTAAEVGLTLVMQGLTALEEVARIVKPASRTGWAVPKPVPPPSAKSPPSSFLPVPEPDPEADDASSAAAPEEGPEAPDDAESIEVAPTEAAPPEAPAEPVVVELEEVSADSGATTVDGPGPGTRSTPLVSVQSEGFTHDPGADTVAEVEAPRMDDDADGDSIDLLELLQFDDAGADGDDRHIVLALDPREELPQALAAALPGAEFRVVAMKTLEDAARFVHDDLPTIIAISAGWHFDAGGAIRAFRDDLTSAFLPVLVLSEDDDHNVELLRAGADEVVPAEMADEELELRLRAVIRRVT